VKLTINLHLFPRVKNTWIVHSFPHTSSWRSALIFFLWKIVRVYTANREGSLLFTTSSHLWPGLKCSETGFHIAGPLPVPLFTVTFSEFVQTSGHSLWDNAQRGVRGRSLDVYCIDYRRSPTDPGPRPQCARLVSSHPGEPGKPGRAKVNLRTATAKILVLLKLRGLSQRANYTDRRLSVKLVTNLADRGCDVVSVTDPYGRIFGSLDRSRYFFFQIVPKLYSRG
jgi:hypothetical protein